MPPSPGPTRCGTGIVLLWRVPRSNPPIILRIGVGPCRIMVLSAVDVCRRMMVSEALALERHIRGRSDPEIRAATMPTRWPALRPDKGHRPAVAGGSRLLHCTHAACPSLADQRKSLPSHSILCRMLASLRATATVAFLVPIRLTSRVPQAFRADHFTTR